MTPCPDLSVIILSYNTCELTQRCIHALLADMAQTPYTVEIIVVDNASTDDTVTMMPTEFPQIFLLVNEVNLGFAGGNNVGLKAARGRYLLLLNSDTEVQAGALAALVEFMETHPQVGASGPMLLNPDGSLQPSGQPLPSVWTVFLGMTKLYRLWKRDFYTQTGRNYQQCVPVGELSGAALLVRRAVYELVGGFDPNFFLYYEDTDWCRRIGQAGYELYYVPEAKVIHHWRGSSQGVTALAYRSGQNSQRYYFAKHHGSVAHGVIQLFLIIKELVLLLVAMLRRDKSAWQFHQKMLINSFSPLPAMKNPLPVAGATPLSHGERGRG